LVAVELRIMAEIEVPEDVLADEDEICESKIGFDNVVVVAPPEINLF
jgi:hypothetical protein